MKQVMVFDGLREFAVRPRALFEEYIALLARDVATHFKDRSQFTSICCPGCGGCEGHPAFEKLSFTYVACKECGSVFVSPRPTSESLREFMEASEAVRFWAAKVEAETAHDRAQSIFYPRAAWVQAGAGLAAGETLVLIDIYSKYPAFLDRVAQSGVFWRVISLAPVADVSSVDGFPVIAVEADFGQALRSGLTAEALSAQECLERDADPDGLVRNAARLLRDGGLLFVTTVSWSGFDLQVLRERSKNILPPTHLNLLSLDGIQRLLARHGFDVFELSTPGQLDTEIVVHAVSEDPGISLPPFVDELIRRRGEDVHCAFQHFLQEALLSSHVRLVARKTG